MNCASKQLFPYWKQFKKKVNTVLYIGARQTALGNYKKNICRNYL